MSYKISQLAVRTSPAPATDWVPVLVTTDTSTPPAGSGGSDQRLTIQALLSILAGGAALWPTGDTTGAGDQAKVTAAISALPARGGNVVLMPGVWTFNAPVLRPSGVTIRGIRPGNLLESVDSFGTVITASSTWAQGSAGLAGMLVHGTGVGTAEEGGFADLTIDGGGLYAAGVTAHGITSVGDVGSTTENIDIFNVSGNGLDTGYTNGTWRVRQVNVGAAGQTGFGGIATDSDYEFCEAGGCSQHGWYTYNAINSRLTSCRSENNGQHGYYIDGDNSATGGLTMESPGTDRNGYNGIYVSATGNWPLIINGPQLRRDGRISTSGGYAGIAFAAGAKLPVIINGVGVFPGYDDAGTGNLSPQYGINMNYGGSATTADVQVNGGLLHAASAPVNGTITSTRGLRGRTGTWNTTNAIAAITDTA